MLRVCLIFREKKKGFYSFEKLFNSITVYYNNKVDYSTVYLPFKSQNILNWWRNYKLIITNHKSDVYHITGGVNFLLYFLNRKQTILTLHDAKSFDSSNVFKRCFIYFFYLYFPLKLVKHFTVISEFTKNEAVTMFKVKPQKIHVIPNCYNPIYKPAPYPKDNFKPVILHIGTKPNKNLENTIEALKGIQCKFIILGKLTPVQQKLIKNYQMDVENYVDISEEHVYVLYIRCNLLVFASYYEGFGLPIIEAQATGRPVVTSNISSMPEVAGDSALLVNPYDVGQIREAVYTVINDPYQREILIQKGFDNVKRFSPNLIAQKYFDLYIKVFNN